MKDDFQKRLESLGFQNPTPIQALSFPALRAGQDLIGESRTGSGKTLAFLLPILEKLSTEGRALQAMVLCPTRELCEQVTREARLAGRTKPNLLVATLTGGTPIYFQIRALLHGAHIIVATPGRLLDLMGREKVDLSTIRTVVLDEADRMLDMGFREPLEQILAKTPADRQTVMFSATFPPTIEKLSGRFQKNPVRISVPDERPTIEQSAVPVTPETRAQTLARALQGSDLESVLVFCNFKASVDQVAQALRGAGVRADKIHGDLEQIERDRVMARFRNGSTRVLVATDVAARGLDISGLDAVINYEIAKDPPTHVHRVGRTGRAGKPGKAITFFLPAEQEKLQRIEAYQEAKIPRAGFGVAKASAPASVWETLELGAGRRDKLRPGDILGALTGQGCELPGTAVGKIQIHDRVSYVAVEHGFLKKALRSLQAGRIKNRRITVYWIANP